MKSRLSLLSKLTIKAEQPLLYSVFNKHGTLLAEKGTLLSESQVKKILDLNEIYTHKRSLTSALINANPADESNSIFKQSPPFKRIAELENILREIYDKPNDSINQSKILTIITRLKTICEQSPDAAIAKIITDNNTNYSIKHAIHTAILCELSGQHLQWALEKRRNISGAALTMNISLGFLQDKLVHQPKSLSLVQKKIIHEHPENSVAILKKMGVSNTTWLELVKKHHEQVDGSGYPQGLQENNIPMAASLITLSDIYCAKVTGRSYREPIFANIAVRDIYVDKDKSSQSTLIEVFVKILGIYPPGCLVKLKSDEIGIVIKRGKTVGTPKVLILSDAKNDSLMFRVVRDTSKNAYEIKSIISAKKKHKNINYFDIWPQ